MRAQFLAFFLLCAAGAAAQADASLTSAQRFVQEHGIRLNTVTPLPGFRLYYNCDSFLFLRGDFGDTIRILTPGLSSRTSQAEMLELLRSPDYGRTVFVESIMDDSDLYVSYYRETMFLRRHDSLFEFVDTLSYPPLYQEVLTRLFSDSTSDAEQARLQARLDSIQKDHETRSRLTTKLIFAPKAFARSRRRRFPRRLNPVGDWILLEDKSRVMGRWVYTIRINNNEKKGEETSYAYAIDEHFRFFWWEFCPGR
ncbi:hypothetical protein [Flaviaesturariibacter aridisoli]|uniref:DUF4919 domain-containing protein n=1 Tax=Flaviaesturariibacter aridisoli TaxID=2545761 RepID=A0A4R4DY62_9BACT|nr:hypothetical protein [Flaviaesturariibacter aridisoli]TCZ70466.1 hypothetical protein E0486_10950 [Flaviaesturariibacter aridisoli]